MQVIAAVTAFVAGQEMNVREVCRQAGVAPKTFYFWAERYRREGLVGLEERSRCPLSVPNKTPEWMEDAIVAERERLNRGGWDHGATSIQFHLGREHGSKVPSVATIHRILVRRGVIEAQPQKRPKSSWRRFEASAPNELWQIDATEWTIATGVVKVFNIIDDHSRVAIRSRAVSEATTEAAWTTFCQGGQQWGLPAGVLSDNGMCFSGKLRNYEVVFEANLRDAGVRPITGRPYHPQTTGKVERFQQTLKKWLRRQRLARSLTELQHQLDQFCGNYNHHRPHQGIGRITPITRWHAAPATQPAGQPLEHPVRHLPDIREITIGTDGKADIGKRLSIHIGVDYIGATATVIFDGLYASVYINDTLVRHLRIDPARRYQPSGKPRGGPRRQRLAS